MGTKTNGSHPYLPDGYEDDDDYGVLETIWLVVIMIIGVCLVIYMDFWDAAREKFRSLSKRVER